MSKSATTKWYQIFCALVNAPGLGNSPERKTILTIFSTQLKQPLCGHLRIYLLNSAEQAFEMLAQNKEYTRNTKFLAFIKDIVANDGIPARNSDDLPKAELLDNTEFGALVAVMVWKIYKDERDARQAKAEEAEADEPTSIPWGSGEKPKA